MSKVNFERRRSDCFGYRHDGKNGCGILDVSPSEARCASCSFYKTEKEYTHDRVRSEQRIYSRCMKTAMLIDNNGDKFVTLVKDEKLEVYDDEI